MRTRVLKWNVPVDDATHVIGGGDVIHIAAQHSTNEVQVWTIEKEDEFGGNVRPKRLARVFGTGQEIEHAVRPLGSTLAGMFVWHVFEVRR